MEYRSRSSLNYLEFFLFGQKLVLYRWSQLQKSLAITYYNDIRVHLVCVFCAVQNCKLTTATN